MEKSTIAVAGSTGLVGTALTAALRGDGHTVHRLVRRSSRTPDEIAWDPSAGTIEFEKLEGLQAIVNLAGRPVAAGRWTSAAKAGIRDSRVEGTALIAATLGRLQRPPATWINASAIGFYGDRGDEALDERSAVGVGFLAETCGEWEAASEPARAAGVRVVLPRIGVVLDGSGGALAKMLPAFRLGLGGRLGSGRQQMSWIGLDDLVALIRFLLDREDLEGPVNAVAPNPVTNAEFTRTLARVLGRPALFPVPAVVLELLMGEMGQELLLGGARVAPARLLDAGFEFGEPQLESALRRALRTG